MITHRLTAARARDQIIELNSPHAELLELGVPVGVGTQR